MNKKGEDRGCGDNEADGAEEEWGEDGGREAGLRNGEGLVVLRYSVLVSGCGFELKDLLMIVVSLVALECPSIQIGDGCTLRRTAWMLFRHGI